MPTKALAQRYEWVNLTPSTIKAFVPIAVSLDSKGNIITLGAITNYDDPYSNLKPVIGGIYLPFDSGNSNCNNKKFYPRGYNYNFYLTKSDTSGNLLWAVNLDPINVQSQNEEFFYQDLTAPEYINEIHIDKDNNLYVGGYSLCDGSFYVSKYNTAGNLIWNRCMVKELSTGGDTVNWPLDPIEFLYHDRFYQVEDNGNILISGMGYHDSVMIGNKIIRNNRSVFMAETDSNGHCIWEQNPYGLVYCPSDTAKINLFAPVLEDNHDGSFYLTGVYTKELDANGKKYVGYNTYDCLLNYFIAKYDTSGSLQWLKPLDNYEESAQYSTKTEPGKTIISDYPPIEYPLTGSGPKGELYLFTGSSDTISFDSLHFRPLIDYSGGLANLGEYLSLYLAKYSPQGQAEWVKQINAVTLNDGELFTPMQIFISSPGYVYLEFQCRKFNINHRNPYFEIKIDNNIYEYSGDTLLIVIACFNPDGTLLYLKQIGKGTTISTGGVTAEAGILTADKNGDVFMSGLIYYPQSGKNYFDSIPISGKGTWIAKLSLPIPQPDSIWYSGRACIDNKIEFFLKQGIKPDSVLWEFGDGDTSAFLQPDYWYAQAGTYKVIFHSYFKGLDDTTSLMISIYSPPPVHLAGNQKVCDSSLVLNPSHVPGETYLWSNGDTISVIIIATSGKYWVTGTINGCSARDTAVITLLQPINFNNDNIKNTVFCANDSTLVLDAGISYKYLWSPNGDTTEKVNITASGAYSVVISATDGCTASKSAVISDQCPCYLYVPNAFTPNHDNLNDNFLAQTECVPVSYTMQIYNRWGEMVFMGKDMNTGWDGTFNNLPCPSGVYVYKIIYKFPNATEQIKTGTLIVER